MNVKIKTAMIVLGTSALLLAGSLFARKSDISAGGGITDADDHQLVELWKQYRAASAKDLPAKQSEILKNIISEALAARLSWDFYDAWNNYADVRAGVNWKERDSVETAFEDAVKKYDEPVVSLEYAYRKYHGGSDRFKSFVSENRKRLEDGKSPAFYRHSPVADRLVKCLPKYISNDYEYALWLESAYDSLATYPYPSGAWAEYLLAWQSFGKAGGREEKLRAVAAKYNGTAVGMYAEGDLLSARFNEADEGKTPESFYKELYSECQDFEKRRSSLKGEERDMAVDYVEVKDLVKSLTAAGSWISCSGDTVTVGLRNLSGTGVSLFGDSDRKRPIWTARLDNPRRSFYVYDTLKVAIPGIDDGDYSLETRWGGKNSYSSCRLSKYTISLALRQTSAGYEIYAADAESGRPLDKVDLVLKKNGAELAAVKDLSLGEGFDPLPASLAEKIAGDNPRRYTLECALKGGNGLTRRSRPLTIWNRSYGEGSGSEASGACALYLDRAAFNPGDTVRFKGIFYMEDPRNGRAVFKNGLADAVLRDSEGNEIGGERLSINEFGSVAGEFRIPEGLRNGMFSIRLTSGQAGASESFRVDEFVLPTFEISFDENDRLWLPGDTVRVTGNISAYSGHSLSGASVRYKVSSGREVVAEGGLNAGPDGGFALDFPTADTVYGYSLYSVEVSVTDATGETLSASDYVRVVNNIFIEADLTNSVAGQYAMLSDDGYMENRNILEDDIARVVLSVENDYGKNVPMRLKYELTGQDGTIVSSGVSASGDTLCLDLSGRPQGLFKLKVSASAGKTDGSEVTAGTTMSILRLSGDAETLDVPLKNCFRVISDEVASGDDIRAFLGVSDGKPVWAVAGLFGENRTLLEKRTVLLSGKAGEEGSLEQMRFAYKDSYPDDVFLSVFYFRDYGEQEFTSHIRRKKDVKPMRLEWERFEDMTMPGHGYELILRTEPGSELLAAVYDKSADAINPNSWSVARPRTFTVSNVHVMSVAGSVGSDGYIPSTYLRSGAGRKLGAVRLAMVGEAANAAPAALYDVMPVAAESAPEEEGGDVNVAVRDVFAGTLAFEPFLRPDGSGKAVLNFSTSGKLSTYRVLVLAHDKTMRNALVSREMVVTLPVKVSLAQPQFLRVGDRYRAAVSLASSSAAAVSGTLSFCQYDGQDYRNSSPVKSSSVKLSVPAGGTVSHLFDVDVPAAPGDMGLKAVFIPDGDDLSVSDAVFVSVPVLGDTQVLTESHSAVVLPGADMEEVLEKLRGEFVNVSAAGAEYKEISILDMLRDAVPSSAEPAGEDVLSLSEALYVRKMAESLGVSPEKKLSDEELMRKLLACRNADGGFGWFEGMNSSPVITAVLLERFAAMRNSGLLSMDMSSSVKYLDDSFFDVDRPLWCGGISTDQYLLVRSLYSGTGFAPSLSGREAEKRMREFKKYVKNYLVPSGERGLKGEILPKARRLKTLSALLVSEDGVALAGKWGVSFDSRDRIFRSLEADVASLLEYAVDHRDGGVYYPNAVMPFRGLLESETYAHSLLCNLLSDYSGGFGGSVSVSKAAEARRVADGIRIWLMVQKETQKWDTDPAYVDAIASVLAGGDDVLGTQVLVMTKKYEKPYAEIKAAGNGFSVERIFLRAKSAPDPDDASRTVTEYERLRTDDRLSVGDRIRIEYRVKSGENRSFVAIRAPHEASLRPVNQLSGLCGLGIKPLRISSFYTFVPCGYRNMKASATEFYFDTWPEETVSVTEDFFVTQEGVFTAPVVEIESLYAPHYRANASFTAALRSGR